MVRLNYFTLDVIGDTAFNDPMGFLERQSDATDAESQAETSYRISSTIDTLHRGVRYSLTVANVPSLKLGRFLRSCVTLCRPLAQRLGSIAAVDFENICIRKLRRRLRNGAPSRPSGDFMKLILAERIGSTSEQDKSAASYSEFRSLVADSVMMMNAGSDTTAAALTSTIWFLLRNPKALARLRQEVTPWTPPSDGGVFAYDDVKDLPYLRACIDESLRLRPPIAYQLPRLVSQPVSIAGHSVLPGTVVAVAPYSIHRHPSLYRDPDAYVPERWLEPDPGFPDQIQDLKQYNIVFSQGSRACIGRHLAIVELQIIVPTLITR